MSVLNPFELLAKLPTPFEVLDGLKQAPAVLRDKDLLASHVSYRLAQAVALAVRQTSHQSDGAWVAESALGYTDKVVDVIVPILNVNHTLRWQVVPNDILVAQRVEPELDTMTITASPAHVTLTVLPSVYDELNDLPLDMAKVMDHVHISGESGLAKWVSRLAEELRPDVWAQLADVVGTTPAGWMQMGFERAKSDLLSLKVRCLDGDDAHPAVAVRHGKLDELRQGVQTVRGGVDALSLRIAKLQAKAVGKGRP